MARSYNSFDYYWDGGVPGAVTSYLENNGYSYEVWSFSSYGKIYHGIRVAGSETDPGATELFDWILDEGYFAYAGSVLTSGQWYGYG